MPLWWIIHSMLDTASFVSRIMFCIHIRHYISLTAIRSFHSRYPILKINKLCLTVSAAYRNRDMCVLINTSVSYPTGENLSSSRMCHSGRGVGPGCLSNRLLRRNEPAQKWGHSARYQVTSLIRRYNPQLNHFGGVGANKKPQNSAKLATPCSQLFTPENEPLIWLVTGIYTTYYDNYIYLCGN